MFPAKLLLHLRDLKTETLSKISKVTTELMVIHSKTCSPFSALPTPAGSTFDSSTHWPDLNSTVSIAWKRSCVEDVKEQVVY